MAGETNWLSATEVVSGVRKGRLDPDEVIAATKRQIARWNPDVRAYTYIDSGPAPAGGSLAGVTLGVKDSLAVKGMPWTDGSPKWRNRIADHDAPCVGRLAGAGAAVLGKLNLPELAASVGTTNRLFPDTQNPWRSGFTPGGSSGGSGAAVAAGLCAVSLGTDMGGSIRIPAACCGTFGLRPSKNRLPDDDQDRAGLSVPGPLTRSVADLELIFGVLAGEASPAFGRRPYRIAITHTSPLGVDDPCAAACDAAGRGLSRLGHTMRSIAWDPRPAIDAYRVIRPVTMGDSPGAADEYGEAVREAIIGGRATSAADYEAAVRASMEVGATIRQVLADADFLLTPTLGMQPMPIAEVPTFLGLGWDRYIQFVLPISFAGLPAVAIPAGLANNLPVSVQLVGPPRGEWPLLRLARELESEGFSFKRPPAFS